MYRSVLALAFGILLSAGCGDEAAMPWPSSAGGQGASGVGSIAGTTAAAPSGAAGVTGAAGAAGSAGSRGPIAGATTPSAGAGGQATAGAGGDEDDAGVPPVAGSGGVAAGASMPSAGMSGGSGSPVTGTFPATSNPAAKGPYTPVTVNNTGPNRAYTLFHPQQLAPEGALNPIVSWGNGGATTPVDYPQLPHLASHGFVVIASNNPLVTSAEVKAGIDWIIAQNGDSSSPFHQKLDIAKIAGVGYSAGGLATLGTADDSRFTTIVIISGANTTESARTTNMPKLHTPIAYLCTADEASKSNCANDYAVVKVPAFFGVMNGSTHVSVTTFLGLGSDAIIDRLSGVMVEWLRWQIMSDTGLKSRFVGADCGLCKDSNWSVEPQKGLN